MGFTCNTIFYRRIYSLFCITIITASNLYLCAAFGVLGCTLTIADYSLDIVAEGAAKEDVGIDGVQIEGTLALYSLDQIRLLTADADETSQAKFNLSSLPAGRYSVKATNESAYRLFITL